MLAEMLALIESNRSTIINDPLDRMPSPMSLINNIPGRQVNIMEHKPPTVVKARKRNKQARKSRKKNRRK